MPSITGTTIAYSSGEWERRVRSIRSRTAQTSALGAARSVRTDLDDLCYPGDGEGHNPGMDPTQTKIIDLLREVHLLALREVERLNLRIVELESHVCQPAPGPAKAKPVERPPSPPSAPKPPETGLLNEHEVAA
jgi:hypothetical protein